MQFYVIGILFVFLSILRYNMKNLFAKNSEIITKIETTGIFSLQLRIHLFLQKKIKFDSRKKKKQKLK